MGYSGKLHEATKSVTTPSSDGYWTYASDTFQSALNSTSEVASSLYESIYSYSYTPAATSDKTTTPSQNFPAIAATPKTNNKFIGWKLQNPYSNIRGNQNQPSSLEAVRSLLRVVPVKKQQYISPEEESLERLDTASSLDMSVSSLDAHPSSSSSLQNHRPAIISKNETASQLAEGTIRALRDLELDEAMQLHQALEYWTLRWERPLLSWMEAGPWVWFSPDGYDHNVVGQRVSQIQAVLARRCAAIGELQQHLLRAGWQKGVAQWGVLGQGGQWANVAGADGAIQEEPPQKVMEDPRSSRRFSTLAMDELALPDAPFPTDRLPQDPNAQLYYGHSNVNVRKTIGGSIVVDDHKLAAWSVDAIWVVRDQLYRASIGLVQLPYAENWRNEQGELIADGAESMSTQLPIWATRQKKPTVESSRSGDMEIDTILEDGAEREVKFEKSQLIEEIRLEDVIAQTEEKALSEKKEEGKVFITDLNVMANEVSELLNSMEVVIEMQRDRRLEKLKGLPLIRRNWYMAAIGAPLTTYLVYRLLKGGHAGNLVRFAIDKVHSFFNEHVYQPLSAM